VSVFEAHVNTDIIGTPVSVAFSGSGFKPLTTLFLDFTFNATGLFLTVNIAIDGAGSFSGTFLFPTNLTVSQAAILAGITSLGFQSQANVLSGPVVGCGQSLEDPLFGSAINLRY
jgi:hypothetical protein